MPLHLIRKLASRIFKRDASPSSGETHSKSSSGPSRKRKGETERSDARSTSGHSGRSDGRRNEPRRNDDRRRARPESGGDARPRPSREPVAGSTQAESIPAQKSQYQSGAAQPTSRRDPRARPYAGSAHDSRRTTGNRGGVGGRMEQGHTPHHLTRPGGAVDAEERAKRQSEHAAWSPDSFVVPPANDKKRFHDFDLPAEVMHAIADAKFEYCTPIQALSLDYALAGRNVAGRAQTGTGKTAAFLIALLTRYLRKPHGHAAKVAAPRALVIAPTRELVIQISRDADTLGKYCNLRYFAVYGGMDYERQRRELEAAPVDLLVATPGRLLDYARGHVVDLSHVDTLVIDEADRMLDMGFIPDVRRIVRLLPPADRRCTMLYSATLNDDVMNLAAQWMSEPVRIEVEPTHVAVNTVTQRVYVVAGREKFNLLYNLLKRHADRRVLVFCNRRDATEHVSEKLRRHGIPCETLSGDVQQNRRLRALEDFRSGRVRVVIATDVAGRGIHVDDIGFVINFDFPYEPEDYVHRIGRTGRAGHAGTAISFADENESFIIPEIEKYLGETLSCVQPEDELLKPPSSEHREAVGHSKAPPVPHEVKPVAPQPVRQPEKPSEDIMPSVGHAPEWPDQAPGSRGPAPSVQPQQTAHQTRPSVPPSSVKSPGVPRRSSGETWMPGQGSK